MPVNNEVKSIFEEIQKNGKSSIYHPIQKPGESVYQQDKKAAEMASEVISLKLDRPVKISTFKKFSKQSRREYILHLYKEYPNLDTSSIAQMMGTSTRIIKMELSEIGISAPNSNGRKAQESREKFKRIFMSLPYWDGEEVEAVPVTLDNNASNSAEIDLSKIKIKAAQLNPMSLEEFKLLSLVERKKYVCDIYNKYPGVSLIDIAKMFATSDITAKKYGVTSSNVKYTIEGRKANKAKFEADMLGIVSLGVAPVPEKKELPNKNTNQKIESVPIVLNDPLSEEPVSIEPKKEIKPFEPKIDPKKFDIAPVNKPKCTHYIKDRGFAIVPKCYGAGLYPAACTICGKVFHNDVEVEEEIKMLLASGACTETEKAAFEDALTPEKKEEPKPEKMPAQKEEKISTSVNNIDIMIDAEDIGKFISMAGIKGKVRLWLSKVE